MARFKGKDTKPELLVRRALHAMGYRFRLHRRDLPGSPDIVLPRHLTIIFVHGCFWHQHEGCAVGKLPRTRQNFWSEKFTKNRERDAKVKAALEASGWRVLTIWECQAKASTLPGLLATLELSRIEE